MAVDYPCGICYLECDGNRNIACDNCDTWFHQKCEKITNSDFSFLQKTSLSYSCSKCCLTNLGTYDFVNGLERLQLANNSLEAARLESIFSRFIAKKLTYEVSLDPIFQKDNVASSFLGAQTEQIAVKTTGNGSCLFNALSLALQGNESLAWELRYRTCLEMIQHRSFYEDAHKFDQVSLVDTYDTALERCSLKYGFSSAFTMHAAASVVGKPIRSLYPSVNGLLDSCVGILNTSFMPRGAKLVKDQIQVLWCSALPYSGSGIWTPNHFVLVLPSTSKNIIDLTDEKEFPSLGKPQSNLESSYNVTCEKESDIDIVTNCSEVEEEINLSQADSSVSEIPVLIEQPFRNPEVGGLAGKFMTPALSVDLILGEHSDEIRNAVPKGQKENVYFLVEKQNIVDKSKRSFVDDCGVWYKNSLKTSYYLQSESGNLVTLFNQKGTYCREIKRKMVPMEPQPETDSVIVLQRYYSKLRKDPNYQRRVSWFDNLPKGEQKCRSVEIYEYIGEYPGESLHGNAKISSQPYKRVTLEQKQAIDDGLKHGKKPIQVSKDLEKIDPDNMPDLKVIQNKKYNNQKRERNNTSKSNMADDFQTILNSLKQNSFIRSVMANNDQRPPNIICYTDEQLEDMKNCMTNGSIIGIDRTFNLGPCYLTLLVYQNPNVKGTSTAPIMLGPSFLHWDGTYVTYCDFLSKIRSALGFHIPVDQIVFGTDEETALVNAIKTTFPSSTHILCVRHLKENAQRNLTTQNIPEKIRNEVINSIFGSSGILHSTSRISFLEREQEVLEKFEDICGKYLKEKLLPTVKEKIFLPSQDHQHIPCDWKNNNCESMNHKIKLLGDWKSSKLPELIERLREIHESQLIEIRGALHGRGNLELAERAKHISIPHHVWIDLNDDQRRKVYNKFLRFKSHENVESKDGQLTIPMTARLAKKPGQVKRVRNAKTTTFTNKRAKVITGT